MNKWKEFHKYRKINENWFWKNIKSRGIINTISPMIKRVFDIIENKI